MAAAAACAIGMLATSGEAAPRRTTERPVVVELFTAQGCSTCPPADAAIAALADQPGVLTLSWHVDYWDYLGWPDSFASPPNTVRQEAYAAAAGERGVYTPQIIVDGQDIVPMSVEALQQVGQYADPTDTLWRDLAIVAAVVVVCLGLGAATLRRRTA